METRMQVSTGELAQLGQLFRSLVQRLEDERRAALVVAGPPGGEAWDALCLTITLPDWARDVLERAQGQDVLEDIDLLDRVAELCGQLDPVEA